MSRSMKFAAFTAVALALAPTIAAADAQRSIDAFNAVAESPEKLETYCKMIQKIDEVGDDEEKAKAAEDEIDGYLIALGDEFGEAWAGGDDLPDGSADLERVENALADLDNRCQR